MGTVSAFIEEDSVTKVRYVRIPLVSQTRRQLSSRLAEAKGQSGTLTLRTIGEPVAELKRMRTHGASPHARRFRVLCRVLGPEEWNLIFPDIPSEYGGTVCVGR